jgi:hypothetical protein
MEPEVSSRRSKEPATEPAESSQTLTQNLTSGLILLLDYPPI